MAGIDVAGGAVGVLSLGITVCQGLVKYYGAWKDSRKDISDMLASVELLNSILRLLQQEISNPALEGKAADAIGLSITRCTGWIGQLQSELQKVQEVKGLSLMSKIQSQVRRLEYPFKESTLHKLQYVLSDLRDNLSLGIDALQLENNVKGFKQTENISSQISDVDSEIQKLTAKISSFAIYRKEEQTKTMLEWLSPLNFYSKQTDHLAKRQKGTSTWLFETPEFKSWISGTQRTLWCSGQPGAGKTILAAAIIDELETKFVCSDIGLAFIYCDYKEHHIHSLANFLASIFYQLILPNKDIPLEFQALYAQHHVKRTRPNEADYTKALKSCISSFSKVFIVVDALDECTVANNTRNKLIRELQNLPENVQLLCTSRHLGDIKESFSGASQAEIRASDGDIAKFLEAQIFDTPQLLRFCKKSEGLQEAIVQTLTAKAQGMFLLAQLYVESLSGQNQCLAAMYEQALDRIQAQPEERSKLAMSVLAWVTCAVRPMTLGEIQHAVIISDLEDDVVSIDIDGDDLPEEDMILTVCGGIVSIDRESNVVRLIHYTAQEFFDKHQAEIFPNAAYQIPRACFRYLMLRPLRNGPCSTEEELKHRLETCKLLLYLWDNLKEHARDGQEQIFQKEIWELITNTSLRSAIYQFWGWKPTFPEPPLSPLPFAAALGLKNTVLKLLDLGDDINEKDSDGDVSLGVAVRYGHVELVEFLLSKGADVKAHGRNGRTPLQEAAFKGSRVLTSLLLNSGADAGAVDEDSNTALHEAAESNHADIVEILIESGRASIDAQDKNKYTPLHYTVYQGYLSIAKMLLERGAKIDFRSGKGETALILAAKAGNGDANITRLLCESSAQVDAREAAGYTALHWAARDGKSEIVDVLLEAGADVDAKCPNDQRPLHIASVKDSLVVVETLLRKGADIEAVGLCGATALHFAAQSNQETIVRLLLEKGAQIKPQKADNWTPLHVAANWGSFEAAELLIQHVAANFGEAGVVGTLLQCGATLDFQDSDGQTALFIAASKGQLGIISLLLDKGANINSADGFGRTPLQIALCMYNMATFRLLIDRGALIETNGPECGSAMTWLAFQGNDERIRRRLDVGEDVNRRDGEGWTMLHKAVEGNHKSTVEMLIQRGAHVDAGTIKGDTIQTPLDLAKSLGFEKIAQILMEKMELETVGEEAEGEGDIVETVIP